jgi:1,4-dihydroxy-2-naphthoate octaprenyltransferase
MLLFAALGSGFCFGAEIIWLYLFFFLLTGIFYNYRPLSMKDRPWGSLLANALMGWIAFAIGWSVHHDWGISLIIDSLPYLFFNTALYLYTILPDKEGDRQSQKKTLAVIFATERLIIAAFILYLGGLTITVCLADYQALFFYVLSLPFFISTLMTRNVAETIRTTKFAILFFALSVCLRLPLYFLLMLGGFVLTKLYFKYRFGFNYPNFSGK